MFFVSLRIKFFFVYGLLLEMDAITVEVEVFEKN